MNREGCVRCGDFIAAEDPSPLCAKCPPEGRVEWRSPLERYVFLIGPTFATLIATIVFATVPATWFVLEKQMLAAPLLERVLLAITFVGLPGFVVFQILYFAVVVPLTANRQNASRRRRLLQDLGFDGGDPRVSIVLLVEATVVHRGILVEGQRGIAFVNGVRRDVIPVAELAPHLAVERQFASWPPRTAARIGASRWLASVDEASYRANAARTRALGERLRVAHRNTE